MSSTSRRRRHDRQQATIESAAAAAGFDPSDKLILLHGDLDIWIHSARNLPNMDTISVHLRRFFSSFCFPFSAIIACCPPLASFANFIKRPNNTTIVTSDPYVNVSLASAVVASTRVIDNAKNPLWDEHFRVEVAHRVHGVELHVKDDDYLGAEHIGTATIPAARLVAGEMISNQWFDLLGTDGNPPKLDCAILVSMRFTPIDQDPVELKGIAGNPEKTGVPQTYFPLRKGGMVTLYQDAHVKEGDLSSIELEEESVYMPARCWEDICHAILEAHHLVYVVGWSVFTEVKLVREPTRALPPGGDLKLGDLLKYKTEEGVRVCMLVWDDKTSHDNAFIELVGTFSSHHNFSNLR